MSLQQHFQLRAQGLGLVAQAEGVSKSQMVAWGATPDEADSMLGLWSVYFGQTPFTGLQRRAAASPLSLPDLLRVEKHVAKVKKQRDKWVLRAQLSTSAPEDIDQLAKAFLDEHQPKKAPEMGFRSRRLADRDRFVFDTDKLLGARLRAVLGAKRGSLEELEEALDKAAGAGLPEAVVKLNLIVPLDADLRLVHTDAQDGREAVFRTVEGATLTGAQVLNAKFEESGRVLAVHPAEGKINLYDTERFANPKQFMAAALMNPTCSWPGCYAPAVECQVNHVVAVKNGGLTNMNNLVMACGYHNGVNDDDRCGFTRRGKKLRGYLDILDGVGCRIAYPGASAQFNASAYRFPADLTAA